MAKQLNVVSLAFQADTSQAKAKIAELTKALQDVSAAVPKSAGSMFNVQELKEASEAATQLQRHLQAAVDVNTGKLNLSTFSASLKSSGQSLESYRQKLEAIGPDGEKAFLTLSKSIATAENPTRRVNARMQEFMTTLKNTARWQISSSILHGFMGAVQQAYGYAQDLNKSLNNIRIVTGYSKEEMADFAIQANKAAKSLSTTTVAYTDAALIYYQQGIRDQAEIAGRTATTVKLANVSRQSAEEVSQQMTAIWNNFYDGSKSLEYYADAITALGATTASSSEEIATGLEKFAAVSKTVGLSYEYATAALATITAQTRQSADTVGTGLRTLFARLESVKLGETLDDGVELNKYSKALDDVGVKILDVNGNMKNMDTILDELAARWNTLSREQQMGLAQTVGGVRQYTNLIALMDNYDKMQQNIATAKGSEGTLDKQSEIYAESWEAASKRVQAALETIYDKLLDDNFFIGLTNGLAKFIEGVGGLVEGLGGVKGILLTVGNIIMQKFAKEAPAALERMKESMLQMVGIARQNAQSMQTENQGALHAASADAQEGLASGDVSMEYAGELAAYDTIAQKKLEINKLSANYSQEEKARAEELIQVLEKKAAELAKLGKAYDDAQKSADKMEKVLLTKAKGDKYKTLVTSIRDLGKQKGALQATAKGLEGLEKAANKPGASFEKLKKQAISMAKDLSTQLSGPAKKDVEGFIKKLEETPDMEGFKSVTKDFKQLVGNVGDSSSLLGATTNDLNKALNGVGKDAGVTRSELAGMATAGEESGEAFIVGSNGIRTFNESVGEVPHHAASASEALMSTAGALMQMQALMNSFTRLGDVFSDDDATAIEKVGAVIGVVTTTLMALNTVSKLTTTLMALENAQHQKSAIAILLQSVAEKGLAGLKLSNIMATKAKIVAQAGETAGTVAQTGANVGLLATMWPLLVVTLALVAAFLVVAAVFSAVSQAFKDAAAASPEGQLKAAEERADAFAEAAEEAAEKVENLKDAFDGYDDVVDKLNSCVKGTDEWNEALAEVNQTVMDMIDEFPELTQIAGAITRNADGMLVISEEARKQVMEWAEQAKASSYAASMMAKADVEVKRTNVAESNLMKSVSGGGDYSTAFWSNDEQGYTNVNLGQFVKQYAQELSGLNETLYNEKIEELAAQYNLTAEGLASFKNELKDCQDEIDAYAKQLDKSGNQMRTTTDLLLSQSKDFKGKSAAELALGGEAYEKKVEQLKQEIIKLDADNNSKGTKQSDTSKDIWARYLKAMGYSDTEYIAEANQVQGNDAHRKYAYHLRGDDEELTVDIETMAAAIAAAEALQDLGAEAEEASKAVAQMDSATQEFIGSGSLEGLTNKEFQELRSKFEGDTVTSDQAYDYLKSQGLSDEMAESLKNDFARNLNIDWDSILSELPSTLDSKLKDGLTISTGKNLADAIGKINLGPSGEKAGETFAEGLNKMLSEVKTEDQQGALEKLANIDWSQWDAMDQAKRTLEEFNVDLDLSDPYWQQFIDDMRKATVAQPNFAKLRDTISSMLPVLQKLKFGDAIKDEDYQKLIAYDSAWKNFFMTQADGSHKFIGDQKAMMDATRDSLAEQKGLLDQKAGLANALNKAGWHNAETGEKIDFTSVEDMKKYNLSTLLDSSSFGNVAKDLGYDTDIVKSWLGDPEKYKGEIDKFYEEIAEYMSKDYEAIKESVDEQIASTATTLEELNEIKPNISTEAYEKQLHLLGMEAANSATSIDELEEVTEKYGLTLKDVSEQALKLTTNQAGLDRLFEEGVINLEQYNEKLKEIRENQINEASTLSELDLAMGAMGTSYGYTNDGSFADSDMMEAYQSKLIELGQSTEHATLETTNYKNAVEELSRAIEEHGRYSEEVKQKTEELAQAEDELRAALTAAEGAAKYGFDAKEIENQAKAIRKLNQDYEMSAEEATQLAITNQRMNKGVSELNKNFSSWKKTLTSTEKTSQDYAKAMTEVESAVADLIGAADDFDLPEAFLESAENMELLEKAANGDVEAINLIGLACSEAQVQAMEFNEAFADAVNIDEGQFQAAQAEVVNGIQNIRDNLDQLLAGTMSIDEAMGGSSESWVESLNQMALATGMSVEQMNGLLNQLGVQAKVDVVDVPQTIHTPVYTEYTTSAVSDPGEKDANGDWIRPPAWKRDKWTVQTGSVDVPGVVQVAQISTDGNPLTPDINFTGVGGTSSGAGGAPRGGGVSPSSTPGGGGGGGGGGGSEPKTKKFEEKTREEKRYDLIKAQLEDQQQLLDQIGKAKDRAYNKAGKMEQEIQAQKKLIELQKEYLKEAEAYLDQDKKKIYGWGLSNSDLDENGNIKDINKWEQKALDDYNNAMRQLTDQYNAGLIDDDAFEERSKQIENDYQQMLDDLSQYTETNNLVQELRIQVEDEEWKAYEMRMEKNQHVIQIRLEFNDRELSYLDYLQEKIDNFNHSMNAGVETMANINERTGVLAERNDILNKGISKDLNHFLKDNKDLQESGLTAGWGKSDYKEFVKRFQNNELTDEDKEILKYMPEEEWQDILDKQQELLDNNGELMAQYTRMGEAIDETISRSVEEMDRAAKGIERGKAALENYQSIIGILGQDMLGVSDALADKLGEARVATANDAVAAAKAKMDALVADQKMIEEQLKKARKDNDQYMIDTLEQNLKTIEDEVDNATSDYQSKWQESAQIIREEFEASTERIKQNLLDSFAGAAGSWSALKDNMEYAQKAAERYVPEYREIYELSKLNRDIVNSINETDNVKNKQMLRDLQKEINKLQEHSGEISEYELENARRQYELTLARLELEEAQNIKDTVRLSKDSEGNWSYIYTANEEEVEKAEQNYEDKLYAMQKANDDYIKQLQNDIVACEEEYANKLAEIMNNTELTAEQRAEAIANLNKYFEEQMGYYTGQADLACENNKKLYEEDWTWYSNYTAAQASSQAKETADFVANAGYKLGAQENFVMDFNQTTLGMQTGFDSAADMQEQAVIDANIATGQMIDKYAIYEKQVEQSLENAGYDMDTFADVVSQDAEDIVEDSKDAKESVESLAQAATTTMGELIGQVNEWQNTWSKKVGKIIRQNEKLAESILAVDDALTDLDAHDDGTDEANEDEPTPTTPEPEAPPETPKEEEPADTRPTWDRIVSVYGRINSGAWGIGIDNRIAKGAAEGFTEAEVRAGQQLINYFYPTNLNGWGLSWEESKRKMGYDTGGYTGDWAGSEGKLALLHSKELVLNKEDTNNILSTVELVRKLSSIIDLNALASEYAMGNLSAAAGYTNSTMEQYVTITAEFPNATNHNEIEEAFKTLINEASQYANRKKL